MKSKLLIIRKFVFVNLNTVIESHVQSAVADPDISKSQNISQIIEEVKEPKTRNYFEALIVFQLLKYTYFIDSHNSI